MALQKLVVTTSWQSFTIINKSSCWTDQLNQVYFATGSSSPNTTSLFSILQAGIKNTIYLDANVTLWLKAVNNSFVFIDNQIQI